MVTTPGFFVVLVHAWKVFLESKDSIRRAVWLQSMFSFTFVEEAKLHRPDTIEGAGGPHAPAGIVLETISLASPSRRNPLSQEAGPPEPPPGGADNFLVSINWGQDRV
jgi:hypothetical protein